MSYDIYLRGSPCKECGRGGDEPDLPGPTYNLSKIFHLALTAQPMPNAEVAETAVVLLGAPTDGPRGLRVLDGRKAGETIEDLRAALQRLRDPDWHARFTALEPPNGWGTLEGATAVVARLHEAAVEHPGHTWEIC